MPNPNAGTTGTHVPPPAWLVALGAMAALALGAACGGDNASGNNNNTTPGVCGDGVTDPREQCDDGAENSDVSPDACRSSCRTASCGDAVVDNGEQCDDGAANSDRLANACRHDCQEPRCGDGVIDRDEACDDGSAVAGDGCDGACQVEAGWACTDEPSVCACADYHQGTRPPPLTRSPSKATRPPQTP